MVIMVSSLFFSLQFFSYLMCSTIISSLIYNQSLPRNNERLVSVNPTQAAGVPGSSKDVTDQIGSAYTSGNLTPVYPQEQTYFYGG